MSSCTITDPGNYYVWAAPFDPTSPATIRATTPDGSERIVAEWEANVSNTPRSKPIEVADVEAGTVLSTDPDETHLIVRRLPDLTLIVYDSHPTGRP